MSRILSLLRKRPAFNLIDWTSLSHFRSLLAERRLCEAAAVLDHVSGRQGLFELSLSPIEIDEADPIRVTFRQSTICIALVAHDHAMNDQLQSQRLVVVLPLLVSCQELGAAGSVKIGLQDRDNCDAVSFCSNNIKSGLIPDHEYLQARGYLEFIDQIRDAPVKWQDRRPVALWRGVTTGTPIDGDWRRLPRIELCRQFAADTERFDIGLTRVVQIADESAETELRSLGLIRDFVSMTGAVGYRYQIDIDGNSNAWAGLFMKLLTGSPVLKIASQSNFRQWYYDKLAPFVNFVPVKADTSDLVAKVDWLRENDKAARKIGEAGQSLALSLRYEREVARAKRTIMQHTT